MMRCARTAADDVVQVLVLPLDLAEDGIQRMLQRPVELVPLRRAQLVEVGVDLLAWVFEQLFARRAPPQRFRRSIWPLRTIARKYQVSSFKLSDTPQLCAPWP